MTMDERYALLFKSAQDSQDKPDPKPLKRGLLPQGVAKEKIQKELFLHAAQRFSEDPSSASSRVMIWCHDLVMRTAMTKFFGK